MKFQAIYRASFYLMLTFATLVLSIDATDDNPFAMLYPLVVGVASILAFVTVDRNPRLALSREAANWLAIGTLIPSVLEWQYDENLLLLAAAHWLVYLQLVKMFLPKSVEDDWFLFLLGLVEVLVGGVMSQSDKVGVALFAWALLSLWVLILFALHREALRMEGAPMGSPSGVLEDRSEPYLGLLDGPFAFSTARVAAITLALGGLIFLATPRRTSMGSSQSTGITGKHLTGFDDEIKLGELGEILENDSPVMSVEIADRKGDTVIGNATSEYRWRGVSMDWYEGGRWTRSQLRDNGYTFGHTEKWKDFRIVRQWIKLEPTDSKVLFALRPICNADAADKRLSLNESDGTLFRAEPRATTFDYSVDSLEGSGVPQPGEHYPSELYLRRLVSIPPALKRQLRPLALAQVKELPETDRKGRAEVIEHYLRDSGEFQYSLVMEHLDPSLDPVEDFVFNRKAGHCEYFASALTLMLRSIDIPARMINGFKGGDYNAIARVTTVRQKHAHSWVEALVDRTKDSDQFPVWVTLDPTPSEQRNASVAKVGGIANNFYQVTDFVRYIWVFYVVGFNSDRQDRFLYRPIRDLIKEAERGFSLMGEAVRRWLHFPSFESFFSLRGFLVSFAALLLIVALVRLATWLVRRILRRFSGPKNEDLPGMAGIQFYRRLLRLLAEYGLDRPPAETPLEFARRAAVFLSGHGSGTEAVADVPALVVDAFYQIRFGEHTIREDDFDRVTARLDALEAHLHPDKTKS
jgi:transglutaminase-like putative cysteine protease